MSINYPVQAPAQLFQEMSNGTPIPCPVLTVSGSVTGAATNVSIVAAVTGKCIRILSANLYSAGAVTTLTFKSGSGGAALLNTYLPANTVATPNVQYAAQASGWGDTAAGAALVADAGAVAAVYSIQYVVYTP